MVDANVALDRRKRSRRTGRHSYSPDREGSAADREFTIAWPIGLNKDPGIVLLANGCRVVTPFDVKVVNGL